MFVMFLDIFIRPLKFIIHIRGTLLEHSHPTSQDRNLDEYILLLFINISISFVVRENIKICFLFFRNFIRPLKFIIHIRGPLLEHSHPTS
jgi:hypothetical protein